MANILELQVGGNNSGQDSLDQIDDFKGVSKYHF